MHRRNPTLNHTYDVVNKLYAEILEVFAPEKFVHVCIYKVLPPKRVAERLSRHCLAMTVSIVLYVL